MPWYSGWTGKSIAVYFYTEIQILAREKYTRMAQNIKINACFDNT